MTSNPGCATGGILNAHAIRPVAPSKKLIRFISGNSRDDYRRILRIVRVADGPVQVRAVGEELGLEVTVRGKLEPLRAKLTKLADRGWLHKRPDGRFTARR